LGVRYRSFHPTTIRVSGSLEFEDGDRSFRARAPESRHCELDGFHRSGGLKLVVSGMSGTIEPPRRTEIRLGRDSGMLSIMRHYDPILQQEMESLALSEFGIQVILGWKAL
jgi:hypothetical protein